MPPSFQAVDTASSRRPTSAEASRCMRKMNSIASNAKSERQRRQRPPFRHDQSLDVDRAGAVARNRDKQPVPDEIETAKKADNVAKPFQQPGHTDGQSTQDNVDADVLALAQQPGRGQQRHQIENVFRDLVADRNAAAAEIARQDVGADHDRHQQQQNARRDNECIEQAPIPFGQSRHAWNSPGRKTVLTSSRRIP